MHLKNSILKMMNSKFFIAYYKNIQINNLFEIYLIHDPIPMYNLAHLYFYENPIENSNIESIKLLIKL